MDQGQHLTAQSATDRQLALQAANGLVHQGFAPLQVDLPMRKNR
jgi:hypothetical protein